MACGSTVPHPYNLTSTPSLATPSLAAPPSRSALWFNQKTDHFDPTNETKFRQRYYVDSSYAQSDQAPIFLFICGEGPCSAGQMAAATAAHAERHHGHMLALEHRYYGLSFPVPDFTTSHLRFLTTAQALADLADFVTTTKAAKGWHGPVIAMGGSYAGSLSAYLRANYPDVVAGALASSGPVLAKENFSAYDLHSATALGVACADATRDFIAVVDHAIDHDSVLLRQIEDAFGASARTTAYDFASYLANAPAMIAQYGIPKEDYCSAIALEPFAAKLKAVAAFYKFLDGLEDPPRDPNDTALPTGDESGGRAWYYQTCTEYGYWQVADTDRSRSVWSKAVDLAHARADCKRLFGLAEPAAVAATNQAFFDHVIDLTTTNILFSNGQLDPWSELSLTVDPPQSQLRQVLTTVIADGHHCDDLFYRGRNDRADGARRMFATLLDDWLGPPPATLADTTETTNLYSLKDDDELRRSLSPHWHKRLP